MGDDDPHHILSVGRPGPLRTLCGLRDTYPLGHPYYVNRRRQYGYPVTYCPACLAAHDAIEAADGPTPDPMGWLDDARADALDVLEDGEERHQQYLLRWDGDDG